MEQRKPMSEADALSRLTARCALSEYCLADMRRMMSRWQLPEGAEGRIISRLLSEKYIDEERYAHAFVRDKFRYNHWGLVRIEQELRRRGIDHDTIAGALGEIDTDASLDSLRHILAVKRRSVSGRNESDIRAKLIRFAVGRGFSYSQILTVLGEAPDCD